MRLPTLSRSQLALVICAFGLSIVAAAIPFVGSYVIRQRVLPRLEARIGRRILVGTVKVHWGSVELRSLIVDGAGSVPPIIVPALTANLSISSLLHGKIDVAEVAVHQPRIEIVQRDGEDNISSILAKLKERSSGGTGGGSTTHIEKVRVLGAAMLVDHAFGELRVGRFDADLHPNGPGEARIGNVTLRVVGGALLSGEKVNVTFTLAHGHLVGLPALQVSGGMLTPFTGLAFTGISGSMSPDAQDGDRSMLDFHGSYGGSEAPLWNAVGWIQPKQRRADLKFRAARFKLSQLESVLDRADAVVRVLHAREAEADGRLDLSYADGLLRFSGTGHLAGLTVAHRGLGPLPVAHLGFDLRLKGTANTTEQTLRLEEAVIDFRNVHATVTADLDRKQRSFAATLQIRPLPCQIALQALPSELTPVLRGFKVSGTFSTDLRLGVVMIDDEATGTTIPEVDLGGKVGIEGCKAVEAPPLVDIARITGGFEQTVEFERGKWLTFWVGPENPEWVPFDQFSPHLINSIMTTEDSNFFKHKGFIPSEFRSALQQNLHRGYFRLGASSITMQMVKNVLLSREKTLSRKLQEMFLTWYVEKNLSKERILEIYFNVIEFGPGIYGIGRAARHYFGKTPKELLPQEAAWFSSILPSPKRRYIQFCHPNGLVDAKWENYLKRIMKRMHERKRLTDEEYQTALATPLVFDRVEAMPEKECTALVRRLSTPLVPLVLAPNLRP